ncbi:glycoside hydrolase family 57 protein [Lacibacter sediminis]|uniref:Alpha-amylase n=1 Tax=Lacibacter sediminis TaxID=2760713 RepID=A0A7G5XDC2_9BACT|nr:glycoside hydrolase family 57 protein [Lacibacter sediminis]QNA43475.1 alpha-amylase [Lacibacter sediminis]
MPFVSFIFRVHQPYALANYTSRDVGLLHNYFDEEATVAQLNRIAEDCLMPANRLLLKLIKEYGGNFKAAFSISGIMFELLELYRPDVLEQFKRLVKTGCVEILGESCNNSASWLYSRTEFKRQVEKHKAIVEELLNVTPTVFRNTELIHDNNLATFIHSLGFEGMFCESVDQLLHQRSRNKTYTSPGNKIPLLLRNFRMSDDIAFRFADEEWPECPLTAEKFASWIHAHPADTECINLMLDYQTFGIYKTKETGIFDFLEALPGHILQNPDWLFATPTAILPTYPSNDVYDVSETISWATNGGNSSSRCENAMQNKMLHKIFSLETAINKSNNPELRKTWKLLQASDYFSYMSPEKYTIPDPLNPYNSAEEAYQNYLNIVTDFELQLIKQGLADYKEYKQPLHYSTLY